MFNKHKKDPQLTQQQLTQCHTRFITMRRKCEVMLEKEVNRARYLTANNRSCDETKKRIKLLYYLISSIDDGIERIYEIHSVSELNGTFSELDTIFKQLNGMSASQSIPKPVSPLKRTSTVAPAKAREYKTNNTLQSKSVQASKQAESVQPFKQTESLQPSQPKVEETPINVDDELEQINMYLEGLFDD